MGGRGGPGGNLGGGGGGGGGGGDKCCSKGKGGAGGPGGPGGGGGSEGESGKPGQLIKTLSSDTPSGGGGGGGRVILGSAIDDIFYNGVIETFGGTSTTSIGGGGVLTFVSSQNVELGSNALFNGFLPLSGADVGSYLISDLPLEDYVLVGGGAGGGAGGYGQAQDDPCCVPEPSTIMGLLAFGTLGAASTLKRKLKSSKLTEKETTKVS
ncbi:MAG: PEP-CTERM sorting domain-containing protein [Microcystis sp.]